MIKSQCFPGLLSKYFFFSIAILCNKVVGEFRRLNLPCQNRREREAESKAVFFFFFSSLFRQKIVAMS